MLDGTESIYVKCWFVNFINECGDTRVRKYIHGMMPFFDGDLFVDVLFVYVCFVRVHFRQ